MKNKLSLISLVLFYGIHCYGLTPPKQVFTPSSLDKISHEFEQMGNMYEVGQIVWGGFPGHILLVTLMDAETVCGRLRGTSRLPTANESEAFALALGKASASGYKPTLVPGFEGRFWVDSIYLDQSTAMVFNTETGNLEIVNRRDLNLVRCVADI